MFGLSLQNDQGTQNVHWMCAFSFDNTTIIAANHNGWCL
jgi:hypothetical protein